MKKYLFIGTSCAIFNINSGSCRSGNEGSKSNKSNKKTDPLKNWKDTLKTILKFKNDHLEDGQSITITKEQIDEAKSAEEIENLKQELEKIRTKPVAPFENVVIDPNNIDLSQPYILKFADKDSEEKATNFIMLINNGEMPAKENDEDDDEYAGKLLNNAYVLAKLPEKVEDIKNFFNDERDKYFLYVDSSTLTITDYDNKENVEVSKIEDLNSYVDTYILTSFSELFEIEDEKELNSPINIVVYKKPSA